MFINLWLVVNFRCCVKVLTFLNVSKCPKTGYFWICFSVLEHYAVTTLRVVKSGSPRLGITKCGCLKKNLGHTRYRADLYGNLVPAL